MVRHALGDAKRSVLGAPGTSAFIVLVLALGIGAATVTFSVVDTVVFRPLPFGDPSGLVVVEARDSRSSSSSPALTPMQFAALRNRLETLESLAAVTTERLTLEGEGEPARVSSARVTASLFAALRVAPLLGQVFTSANEADGCDDVAVLGYDLWRRQFGGDAGIIGRTIRITRTAVLGGKTARIAVTVLGVMPRGFVYPVVAGQGPELWTPYVMSAEERVGTDRSRYLDVIGRLRPHVSPDQSQVEATAIATMIAAEPGARDPEAFRVVRLKDRLVEPVRGWMLLILCAVGFVVAIACVNVANLQLTRAAYRARELSIRASLGATRRQVVLSLVAESLMLSLTAAALAIVLAGWGIGVARASLPAGIPRLEQMAMDARVLIAAIGTAVAAGLAFGVVPAWHASRDDLVTLLKQPATTAAAGPPQWRAALAVAQVAFITVLLVATALMVGSFIRVSTADLGFDRSDLLVVGTRGLREARLGAVMDRVGQVSGVASTAAVAYGSPPLIAAGFGGGASATRIQVRDARVPPALVEFRRVSSGYFATAGIAVVRGRVFGESDADRAGSLIVDERTAAVLFGTTDPVGAEVSAAMPAIGVRRVVAVVRSIRMSGPERPSAPQIYLPLPADTSGADLLVRFAQPAAAAVPAIRAALEPWRPAGGRPVQIRSVEDAFRNITADRRFNATLMALFGVLALLLGSAGVYGVMSSIVAQRTREHGVRLALGATTRQVMGGVLAHSLRYLVAGLAIGLPMASGISRVFAGLLFGVGPTDVSIYAIVAAVLLGAGVAAALVPAFRAARVDPLITLRAE